MNACIIFVLCFFGYFVMIGVVKAILDYYEPDSNNIFYAFLWPLIPIAMTISAIIEIPYRITTYLLKKL